MIDQYILMLQKKISWILTARENIQYRDVVEESFQVIVTLYFTTENFLSLSVIYFEFILQLCFLHTTSNINLPIKQQKTLRNWISPIWRTFFISYCNQMTPPHTAFICAPLSPPFQSLAPHILISGAPIEAAVMVAGSEQND